MITKRILLVVFTLLFLTSWGHPGGHDTDSPQLLKTWTLQSGQTFKGHFSFSSGDIIVIENENHELVKTNLTDFIQSDQALLLEKIKSIKALNLPLENSSQATEKSRLNSQERIENKGALGLYTVISILSIILLIFVVLLIAKKRRIARIAGFIGITFFLGVYTACNRKGCTDPLAENYNEKSKKDDGSCFYQFNYSDQPLSNSISAMTAAFAPYSNHVSTSNDGTWFIVSADGQVDDANIMAGITAWIAQFPTLQRNSGNNSWKIPITPTYSSAGYTIEGHFKRQAIGVAANGIAIFNPYNASQLISKEIGELDAYGGHSGTADDYHYHAAPLHLDNPNVPTIIAYMLDGFPVYGALEPDGSSMGSLDPTYHGHELNGAFHYHGTEAFPYLVKTFRGSVSSSNLADAPFDQIDPQPIATNFRGNPFPMFTATLPHHIDSLIPNATHTGGTLYVSYGNALENQKSCTYWWVEGTTQDSLYFNFYDENGVLENSEAYSRNY